MISEKTEASVLEWALNPQPPVIMAVAMSVFNHLATQEVVSRGFNVHSSSDASIVLICLLTNLDGAFELNSQYKPTYRHPGLRSEVLTI